ncbi:NADH-quinone oxidoreductase subunit NuoN [Candidatus Liberibacter sp.]|uniref:NADH-quinone oxidoreductase subunit NuoN n=1 Tax=Candidatus Liberibacter sp. TaxID=34022 RepID=UPI0015F4E314|nr:NADH-quinone oxidoreductase subunit NuoN [Candidatus Liberibacter sp.]MBA5724321.1 NADH-quinone oxidoreductase subunit NuoN [Candidatus Liberibacter sp.]
MISANIIGDLRLCIPELIIAIGSLFLLLIGVFSRKNSSYTLIFLSIVLLGAAFVSLFFTHIEGIGFNSAYISDGFSQFAKAIVLAGSIIIFIMILSCVHLKPFSRFEFPVVLLIAILGMLLMISAHDMISFYLSLELQSLALYVIVAMNRSSMHSIESALKYFVLGALSSCFLLYGMSFIYGFTGWTDFSNIAISLFVENDSFIVMLGLVFVLAGIFFKISLVPFHMWTPDVYEGSPMLVTAFLATIPKFAVTMALVRIMVDAFRPVFPSLIQIFMFVSVSSMVLGSVAAIGQKDLRRFMAYSSIVHVGYAFLGLLTGTALGISAMIRYMVIYLVMVLGSFSCMLSLRYQDGKNIKNISDLSGLSKRDPFLACILTVLMFSLAGIPPFAGFFGKYFVFFSAIDRKLYLFTIIGLLSSVVSAYYYLRIVKVMWFDKVIDDSILILVRKEIRLILGVIGFFAIAYFLFERSLNSWIGVAMSSLF